MTVASQTRSWQKRPVGQPGPPAGPPAAPSLFPLRDYLMERSGGQDLSAPNLWTERPIVGGSAPSSHRGAAFDWRYMAADGSIGPGPGRQVLLREVVPFLLSHSLELNVQQVHDYVGCTIWKAERAGNEDGGWKTQTVGSQMGQPWAGSIHVEAGEWGWDDSRPVVVKLGLVPDNGRSGNVNPHRSVQRALRTVAAQDRQTRAADRARLGTRCWMCSRSSSIASAGASHVTGRSANTRRRRVHDMRRAQRPFRRRLRRTAHVGGHRSPGELIRRHALGPLRILRAALRRGEGVTAGA